MNYKQIMLKARKTNQSRDALEQRNGFATPWQGPLSQQLRTVMAAIECGIHTDDWDCVAEGQAMLEVIELGVRTRERTT